MDAREKIIRQMLGKPVHVVVDRPVGYLHGDILYPVNYGYIPGLLAGDGEEQDVYILGVSEPLDTFDGRVIGAVQRKNDCEDKLVAAPDGVLLHQAQIEEKVRFQEQYFDHRIVSLLRKSCGVIPYRIENGQREYLIVLQEGGCWSFPKGHMEVEETETETALRELFEETGLTARLDADLFAVTEYPISPIVRKQVVLFPAQVSGTPKTRAGEIEGFKWVRKEELKRHLIPGLVDACWELLE